MMTPPLHYTQTAADPGGAIQRLFHRWLQSLRKNALQFSSVDVNCGTSTPFTGTFTITDPEINEASRMLVIAKPDDEQSMEPIEVVQVVPAAGSASVEWTADGGGVEGTRTFFYAVSG